MTNSKTPRLCGGILFDLLLEARKDGFKDPAVYTALCHVVTGEKIYVTKQSTFTKCVSNYKKCCEDTGNYFPLTDERIRTNFKSKIASDYSEFLQRMSEFIATYLKPTKYVWLVKALIETIKDDSEIGDSIKFSIDYERNIRASELRPPTNLQVDSVALEPFLLTVLSYVLLNCPGAIPGRATFEQWHHQPHGKGSEWKFCGNIGNASYPLEIQTPSSEKNASSKMTSVFTETLKSQIPQKSSTHILEPFYAYPLNDLPLDYWHDNRHFIDLNIL